MMGGRVVSDSELEHYGVLGMKWGVRNYQNEDGTLTSAGKIRYSSSNSITGYIPNKNLKVSHALYEVKALKNADNILKIWTAAFGNPTRGRLKAAEDLTGIHLEKLPETAKDMEPVWDLAYSKAAKELYGNTNEKQRAAMIAYEALVQAGIEDHFDIGFESNNGKESVVFIHTDSGAICRTISEARAYMKSVGRKSREKNVQGEPISVKVNKNKSTGSKPVSDVTVSKNILQEITKKNRN